MNIRIVVDSTADMIPEVAARVKVVPMTIHFGEQEYVSGVDIDFKLNEAELAVEITATAKCAGQTGVEMEALSAVSIAALTVYDMCKAVQKDMVISDIRLISKTGGVHGDYYREEE